MLKINCVEHEHCRRSVLELFSMCTGCTTRGWCGEEYQGMKVSWYQGRYRCTCVTVEESPRVTLCPALPLLQVTAAPGSAHTCNIDTCFNILQYKSTVLTHISTRCVTWQEMLTVQPTLACTSPDPSTATSGGSEYRYT